jgi:membrane protease YdiL (CAAX protease family)
VLYALSVYALTWLTGLGAFSTDVLAPDQSLAGFVVSNATLGFLLSLVSALGEEIGWRGFLVSELAKLTTFAKTSLISGAIWAVWRLSRRHAPLVLSALFHHHGHWPELCLCLAAALVGEPVAGGGDARQPQPVHPGHL